MLVLSLIALTGAILSLTFMIHSKGSDIANAIREQTKYFQSDDDLDHGDEWKRLIK